MKSYATPLKTAENRADEFYGREWLCTRLTGCRFQTRKPLKSSKHAFLREGAARPQAETVNGNGF